MTKWILFWILSIRLPDGTLENRPIGAEGFRHYNSCVKAMPKIEKRLLEYLGKKQYLTTDFMFTHEIEGTIEGFEVGCEPADEFPGEIVYFKQPLEPFAK